MIPLTLNVDVLARAKETCRAGLPSKSGHVDEALAAGFGFRTRAALLPELDRLASVDILFDPAAFATRLSQLDPSADPALARYLGIQSVCSGFNGWDAKAMSGNPRDAFAGIATVALWRAVRQLCQADRTLLPDMLALTPVVDPEGDGLRLEGAKLRFPLDLGTRDPSVLKHSLRRAAEIVGDERPRPSGTLAVRRDEAPRRLRAYGATLETREGISAAIARFSEDPDGFGEREGHAVGTFLARAARELEWPSADQGLRSAIHRAAAARLSETVAVDVQSEAWVGSMFPSTNTKFFMRIEEDWERSIDVRGHTSERFRFRCLPGVRDAA